MRKFIILSASLFAWSASAYEAPRLSGFMSAMGSATDCDYIYTSGADKEFNLQTNSKVGLNISSQLSDQTDVALQLISRFNSENAEASLDWGFVRHYFVPNIAFKLGKQRFPMWLISDYYDVGYTYPWARAPDEVYQLLPIRQFSGASLSFEPSFSGNDLSVQMFAGSLSKQFSTVTSRGPISSASTTVRKLIGMSTAFSNDFFTARAAYAQAVADIATSEGFSRRDLETRFQSFGIKVDWNNFVLYTEYAKTDESISDEQKTSISAASRNLAAAQQAYTEAVQASGAESDAAQSALQNVTEAAAAEAIASGEVTNSQGHYLTLGYRFGKFLPTLTFAELNEGEKVLFRDSQRSFTVGLRVEAGERTALKLDYQTFSIDKGDVGLFLNPEQNTSSKHPDGASIIRFGFDTLF